MSHVLILEDDTGMRSLLKTLLEIEGFEVSTIDVVSEPIILDGIRNIKPDLLFMDVNMKGVSGISVLKKVRQESQFGAMKIVMTSGEDLRKQCMDAGATDFFLKPYMPSDLIKKMRSLTN
jgi:DNA-binding response OmpR family regulator